MKIVSCLAVFSASLLLASVAHAQEGAGGPPPLTACKDDVKTYCGDVQPGDGRILNCLEEHYKDVSDSCYSLMQNAEAHRPKGHNPPPPPPEQGN